MKRRLLSTFATPRFIKHCSRRLLCSSGSTYAPERVVDAYKMAQGSSRGQYFDKRRYWQAADGGHGKRTASCTSPRSDCERFEFTLMSYNILAQDLLEGHAELYSCHNRQALSWPHRYERLMAEIGAVRPDVLCVQELQQDHLEQFWSGLVRFKYDLLYKKRTGGGKTDGCAVFYRRELFDLVTHHEVEYFQPNVNKLNRENVAIIAKLALKSNPQAKLVVSTTHLLYNPRRQDVRLAQIQVLLAELDRLAYSGQLENGLPQYDPIILCGDFNLQPHSAPYQLLTKRYLRYDHLIARTLESEGSCYSEPTGRHFLPESLGITDSCQHNALTNGRSVAPVPPSDVTKLYHSSYAFDSFKACQQGNDADASASNGFPEPTHDGQEANNKSDQPAAGPRVFSTGTLSHRFLFQSAYPHPDNSRVHTPRHGPRHNHHAPPVHPLPTATTFQDQWITVDYMFYTPFRSVVERKPTLPNWNLELLATYALPTVHQCLRDVVRIPNKFYGADHFSLAGRFLLTTPKASKP